MPVGIVQGITSSPGITPTAITGANNNYNPSGMVPGSTLWLDLSAAASLTGLAALPSGSTITIVNISTTQARVITLNNQNASSTATNRFVLPNGLDWIIPNGGAAVFRYYLTNWYLVHYCGNHFPAGSTTKPGITFGTVTNAGIYHDGTNPNLAAGGQAVMSWKSTQITAVSGVENDGTESLGSIYSSSVGTDQTDWAPASVSNARILRITATAAFTIKSIVPNALLARQLRIWNIATNIAFTMTLLADDGASGSAANRILCPAGVSLVIPASGSADLEYDTQSSRWRASRRY